MFIFLSVGFHVGPLNVARLAFGGGWPRSGDFSVMNGLVKDCEMEED
jgi:hypothetical protein